MENETVQGSLQEMVEWMQENKVAKNQIESFAAKISGHGGGMSTLGMAKNCTRTTSRMTGNGETGICTTITCCTTFTDKDGNKETICDSTTSCR